MASLPNAFRGRTRSLQIEHLFLAYHKNNGQKDRTLLGFTLPPFQRGSVWGIAQQRAYVEGIFLGLGTGQYVVNGRDWNKAGEELLTSGWLIDGQQRITAIRDFVEGRLAVFDDIRFGDLQANEARRFLRTGFPCFELEFASDVAVLRSLYDRLNFCSTAHQQSERVKGNEDGKA